MTSDPQWKEIALQYRREIELLHKDIEHAIEELEKKMPRSFEKGIGILERSLFDSQENLFLIRFMEYPIISQKVERPISNVESVDNCFEGLL